MAFDRNDFNAGIKERAHARASELMPLVRLIAGAVPLMEALVTKDEHWNRYLQYLNGLVGHWQVKRDEAAARLINGSTWNHEDLLKLKSDILVADAMIAAWKIAMDLPKTIVGCKDQAQNVINELGDA